MNKGNIRSAAISKYALLVEGLFLKEDSASTGFLLLVPPTRASPVLELSLPHGAICGQSWSYNTLITVQPYRWNLRKSRKKQSMQRRPEIYPIF